MIGTKYSWEKVIQVCSIKKQILLLKRNKSEILKIHWTLKIFSRTTGTNSAELVVKHHWVISSNKDPSLYQTRENVKKCASIMIALLNLIPILDLIWRQMSSVTNGCLAADVLIRIFTFLTFSIFLILMRCTGVIFDLLKSRGLQ